MKKPLVLAAATLAAVTGVAAYTQVGRSDPESAPLTARVTRGDIVDTVDATELKTNLGGVLARAAVDRLAIRRHGRVVAYLALCGKPVTRSDRPVPRLSKMMMRALLPNWSSQRAKPGSSQQASACDTKPGASTRSTGPSPNTW